MRYPGRWHFAGVPIIYTSTSASLAALEMLVHMEIRHAPNDLVLISAEVPNKLITHPQGLPDGWDQVPAGERSRKIGSQWQQDGISAALLVPSVVMPSEDNLLLNPQHPDFTQITIEKASPFSFDLRLRG